MEYFIYAILCILIFSAITFCWVFILNTLKKSGKDSIENVKPELISNWMGWLNKRTVISSLDKKYVLYVMGEYARDFHKQQMNEICRKIEGINKKTIIFEYINRIGKRAEITLKKQK